MRIATTALICLYLAAGCDSGTLWKDDPYIIGWIDTGPASLGYLVGDSGGYVVRVEGPILAVAADDNFVVVKRQIEGQESIEFLIVEKQKDCLGCDREAVSEPLTTEQFRAAAETLQLPELWKAL